MSDEPVLTARADVTGGFVTIDDDPRVMGDQWVEIYRRRSLRGGPR